MPDELSKRLVSGDRLVEPVVLGEEVADEALDGVRELLALCAQPAERPAEQPAGHHFSTHALKQKAVQRQFKASKKYKESEIHFDHLVDLDKHCKMRIWLQKSALILKHFLERAVLASQPSGYFHHNFIFI